MRILKTRDYDHMSRQAANIISAQVILNPESVLGLATGSSPVGTYRQLIAWYKKGDLDFSKVKTVNLDEYVGLAPDDIQSYQHFMKINLFDQINIDPSNTHVPIGVNPDADAECARYDALIKSLGGIDLQLLGLGPNGHIGFNEPDTCFTKGTHQTALAEETLTANRRFFKPAENMPRFAYTMGVCDIMQARRVLMVVSGEAKAAIVREAFFGPVTPQVPASILQLHKSFTLVADEAALSKI
ncbi:MAG: glucosamine-6-phosphate deaminase [Lachnospiraceae bacterium]|nr:glucosamine-6-phosphate deaminase [Lachnospiraceae bacterium]